MLTFVSIHDLKSIVVDSEDQSRRVPNPNLQNGDDYCPNNDDSGDDYEEMMMTLYISI